MTEQPEYDERLGVPLRWWAQGTMAVAIVWLAVSVATYEQAPWLGWTVLAVAMGGLALFLRSYGDARVTVEDGWFRAGQARIEAKYVGDATALDADETRRIAGRDADARAYLVLRPYLKRAVQVQIEDPADPTPYWLVSSRHPEALAGALATLRD